MALIATEECKIGFVVAALPGNVVTAEAVELYGWQDKVKDDGHGAFGGSSADTPDTADTPAAIHTPDFVPPL